ncbi:MAG: hypothetical protein QM820_09630 [Minicystis sp.]
MRRALMLALVLSAACSARGPEPARGAEPALTAPQPIDAVVASAPAPPPPAPSASAPPLVGGQGGGGRGLCIRLAGPPSGPQCTFGCTYQRTTDTDTRVRVERATGFTDPPARDVEAMYASYIDYFRSCFEEALGPKPDLHGRLRFSIGVTESGCGGRIRVIEDGLGDKQLRECLVASFEWLPILSAAEVGKMPPPIEVHPRPNRSRGSIQVTVHLRDGD